MLTRTLCIVFLFLGTICNHVHWCPYEFLESNILWSNLCGLLLLFFIGKVSSKWTAALSLLYIGTIGVLVASSFRIPLFLAAPCKEIGQSWFTFASLWFTLLGGVLAVGFVLATDTLPAFRLSQNSSEAHYATAVNILLGICSIVLIFDWLCHNRIGYYPNPAFPWASCALVSAVGIIEKCTEKDFGASSAIIAFCTVYLAYCLAFFDQSDMPKYLYRSSVIAVAAMVTPLLIVFVYRSR
jgi:hypothetical protein